jgi:hypothetical protein
MERSCPLACRRKISCSLLCLVLLVLVCTGGAGAINLNPQITINPNYIVIPTTPMTTTQPQTVTCTAPCECMLQSGAVAKWGADGYTQCSELPCGQQQAVAAGIAAVPVNKYCYKAKPVKVVTARLLVTQNIPPAVTVPIVQKRTCSAGLTLCGLLNCVNTSINKNNCGSCGNVCPAEQICKNGKCTVRTVQKHTCAAGLTLCNLLTCINTNTDSKNCGSCGHSCPVTQVCTNGKCSVPVKALVTQDPCTYQGKTNCGGTCIDTAGSDNNNCGGCGWVCPYGLTCDHGECVTNCPAGQADCRMGECDDLQTDPNNCGDCGIMCSQGQKCCNGGCSDTLSDAYNCGSCGYQCSIAGNEICRNGLCACPAGTLICNPATGCTDVDTNPNQCGSCNHVCAQGQTCYGGYCQDPYIRLLFVPLNWAGDQASFDTAVDQQVQFFTSAIPLSNCPYRIGVVKLSVANQNFNTFTCNKNSDSGLSHIQDFVNGLGINRADYNAVVGIVQNSPCPNVAGWSNLADTVWVLHIPGYTSCTAHELGHIYGLADEYCSNPAGSTDCRCNDGDVASTSCGVGGNDGSATGDHNWLDSNLGCSPYSGSCCSGCVQTNYNICCGGNQGTGSGRCVMTYLDASPDPRSFCQHCQDWLATVPQLQCHSPPMPLNRTIIDLSATIHADDTVSGDRIILNDGRPSTDIQHGQGYRVAVLNAQGATVKEYRFDIYFDYYGPRLKGEDYSSIQLTAVPISYRIPYDSTMQKLEIYHGDKRIFSKDLNFCNSNKVCDTTETYQTCPNDCPLNSKDTVCTAVKDAVCDPDCSFGVDPDCGAAAGQFPQLPVILAACVILVVAGAGAVVWYMRKGKKPQA